MAPLQKVNVGSAPDATPADPIRMSFQKVNGNFDEVEARLLAVTPFVFFGAWQAGTYAGRSVVTHAGSTWYAPLPTSEQPGAGNDWEVLLDGTGAAGDRQAAQAAATTAASAATASGGSANAAGTSATNAAADRVQTGQDRTAVAADRATVTTDRATVAGIYAAVTAAPVTISAATYTLQADDFGKVLRFTGACVVTLPADPPAGWYCTALRVGSGAVSFVAAAGASKAPTWATRIAAQWGAVTLFVESNDGITANWVVQGSAT